MPTDNNGLLFWTDESPSINTRLPEPRKEGIYNLTAPPTTQELQTAPSSEGKNALFWYDDSDNTKADYTSMALRIGGSVIGGVAGGAPGAGFGTLLGTTIDKIRKGEDVGDLETYVDSALAYLPAATTLKNLASSALSTKIIVSAIQSSLESITSTQARSLSVKGEPASLKETALSAGYGAAAGMTGELGKYLLPTRTAKGIVYDADVPKRDPYQEFINNEDEINANLRFRGTGASSVTAGTETPRTALERVRGIARNRKNEEIPFPEENVRSASTGPDRELFPSRAPIEEPSGQYVFRFPRKNEDMAQQDLFIQGERPLARYTQPSITDKITSFPGEEISTQFSLPLRYKQDTLVDQELFPSRTPIEDPSGQYVFRFPRKNEAMVQQDLFTQGKRPTARYTQPDITDRTASFPGEEISTQLSLPLKRKRDILVDQELFQETKKQVEKAVEDVPVTESNINWAWRTLNDTGRGLAVTSVWTTARNIVTQAVRSGWNVLDTTLQAGIEAPSGQRLHAMREESKAGWKYLENILSLATNKAGKKDEFNALLEGLDSVNKRNLGLGTAEGVLESSVPNKLVQKLNFLNRWQEDAFRGAGFYYGVERRLREAGRLDLIRDLQAVDQFDTTILPAAIKEARELTFSADPGEFGKGILAAWNKAFPGILLSPAVPYPRFVMNSFKTFYQFNPLGLIDLARGTRPTKEVVSRAIVGTGMLAAAAALRETIGGDKWNELRANGEVIDAQAYNPVLAPYLFEYEILKRGAQKALGIEPKSAMTPDDYAKGVLLGNRAVGASKTLLDLLASGGGNWENLDEVAAQAYGEWAARATVPLRQVSLALAVPEKLLQGIAPESLVGKPGDIPPEAVVRETQADTLLEQFALPSAKNIPGVGRFMNPSTSPIRSAPRGPKDLLELFSYGAGFSLQNETPVEAEAKKLGLTPNQLYPQTGNAEANYLIRKYMGPLVEPELEKLVHEREYQQAGPKHKEQMFLSIV